MSTIIQRIAVAISATPAQVEAAVALLDGGATVPFVARYRKEVTGGLDDIQLRALEERLSYLRELDARRDAIITEIDGQGRLTPALRAQLTEAETKARLEDLYLPYRPKRRTKAQAARESGLLPLAELLLASPGTDPAVAAAAYVDAAREVADPEAALAGAKAILVERLSEDAGLVGDLREGFWKAGRLASKVKEGKEAEGAKFADYFTFEEPFGKMPSHRILALMRGERDGVLDLDFTSPDDGTLREPGAFEHRIAHKAGIADRGRPADRWLRDVVGAAWRHRIRPSVSDDARQRLKETADEAAIQVFGTNVRDLLMSAPAGARTTIGLDPGLRTGVKVAVIDATGKVVATDTIYPHEPRRQWRESIASLAALCRRHRVELVAVGNGTGSRETDRLVADLAKAHPDLALTRAMVSEAGASIYSASAYASQELPDLDVTIRGAVSIARRLQDPLAELVKIDPKSIGVGQYQHDVDQSRLARKLDAVVEDCVNAVGVDANTASARLLVRVSGIGEYVASNIVAHRDANGPFPNRASLRGVPGLGPKAFELCAGFLRIRGDDPLDVTGVHPEAYPLVRRIIEASGLPLTALMGNAKALRALRPEKLACERYGVPTVTDVLRELEKPGRDPRPAFATATFKEGVERMEDLRDGMILEGVVTNVAAFGAFVDIGVHQDGLVHVSAMSRDFVRDPSVIAKPGDVVRVKVMSIDKAAKRVALSMRLDDEPGPSQRQSRGAPVPQAPRRREEPSAGGGAFAAAFARAGSRPGRDGR